MKSSVLSNLEAMCILPKPPGSILHHPAFSTEQGPPLQDDPP